MSDVRKIAKNYVYGQFWIDLFSTIPFESIGHLFENLLIKNEEKNHMILQTKLKDNTYNLISCLKLIRVLRLGKLINYLNESDDFKLQLRLLKLCFFFLLYCHISACIWYMINTTYEDEWTPP